MRLLPARVSLVGGRTVSVRCLLKARGGRFIPGRDEFFRRTKRVHKKQTHEPLVESVRLREEEDAVGRVGVSFPSGRAPVGVPSLLVVASRREGSILFPGSRKK